METFVICHRTKLDKIKESSFTEALTWILIQLPEKNVEIQRKFTFLKSASEQAIACKKDLFKKTYV